MKILFEHANTFSSTFQRKGQVFENALVARICIEPGDSEKIHKITEDMLEVFSLIKPRVLIIFPFSHLSRNLMKQEQAKKFLARLTEKLKKKIAVQTLAFGTSKGYSVDVKEHKLNNIYREY